MYFTIILFSMLRFSSASPIGSSVYTTFSVTTPNKSEDKLQINGTNDDFSFKELNESSNASLVIVLDTYNSTTNNESLQNTSGVAVDQMPSKSTPLDILQEKSSVATLVAGTNDPRKPIEPLVTEKQMAPIVVEKKVPDSLAVIDGVRKESGISLPTVMAKEASLNSTPILIAEKDLGQNGSQQTIEKSMPIVETKTASVDHKSTPQPTLATSNVKLSDLALSSIPAAPQLNGQTNITYGALAVRVKRQMKSKELSEGVSTNGGPIPLAIKVILSVLLLCLLFIAFLLTAAFFRFRKIESQLNRVSKN